jgi:hypothetical protein
MFVFARAVTWAALFVALLLIYIPDRLLSRSDAGMVVAEPLRCPWEAF